MISPGTWPHYIRCSRASGNSSAGQTGQRVLTCGYSCTALRNYFKLWRTAEGERDWEECGTFSPLAGCTSGRKRNWRERKKRNVNALSLLHSFFHFSSSSLLPLLQLSLAIRLLSVVFFPLRGFSFPRYFFHFHHPSLLWPRCLLLSPATLEQCFLFPLLETLLLTHACILSFNPSFLFTHSAFLCPFCLLISISSVLILILYYHY